MDAKLPNGRVLLTPGSASRPVVGQQNVNVDSGFIVSSNSSFCFGDALGMTMIVHPNGHHYGGDEHILFYRKTSVQKRTGSVVPQHDLRNHVGGVITEDLIKTYDEIFACYQHSRNDSFGFADVEVAFKVSVDELRRLGGVAYYSEIDLVIGFQNRQDAVVHPRSPVGQIKQLSNISVDTGGNISGGEFFIINEIEEPIGKRFAYMNDRVIEVFPTKRSDMQGGVFHLLCEGDKFTIINAIPWSELGTAAEEEMGLYLERSRAAGLGNRKAAFERETAELGQANARDKIRYEIAKRKPEEDSKAGLDASPNRYLNMLVNIIMTIGFPLLIKKLFDWGSEKVAGNTKAK